MLKKKHQSTISVAVFDSYAYLKDDVNKATQKQIKQWLANDVNYACLYTLAEYEEYANERNFDESYIRFIYE